MVDAPSSLAPDHAGVHVPPPLIYAAGFGLGLLLQWSLSAPPIPLLGGRVAATLCVILWLVLFVPSISLFRRAHTHIVPSRPTTRLILCGPYRFTRNPMYVSLISLYVGLTLWFDALWPLALLPLVILTVRYGVIAREERYLERKFGRDYLLYKTRVRRWI